MAYKCAKCTKTDGHQHVYKATPKRHTQTAAQRFHKSHSSNFTFSKPRCDTVCDFIWKLQNIPYYCYYYCDGK